MHIAAHKIYVWLVTPLLAVTLSGCAILAPHNPGANPSASPTIKVVKSTPSATSSPQPSKSAPGATPSPEKSTPRPTPAQPAKTSGTTWTLGAVSFQTPNWMSSPAADYGLSFWPAITGNLTLQQNPSEVMVIETAQPGQSTSVTADLNQLMTQISGGIQNGPIVGSVNGATTKTYLVSFNSPESTQVNALVIYWFGAKSDVAVMCTWNSQNTGVQAQSACHSTVNSLH